MSTGISFCLKFNSRQESILWLLQKERNIYLFIKSYQRTLKSKNLMWQTNSCLQTVFLIRIAKYLKDNKHNSLYFVQKHTHVFVLGHYLCLKAHSFCQIMSVDKYSWIFSCQIEAIVYIHTYIYINCLVMICYLWANIFQGL